MLRSLMPLIAFLLLIAFLAIGLTLDPREVPSPLVGKPAPSFVLPQLGDAAASITNDHLKGRITLLNVWASWCTACRQEHPLLLEIATRRIVPIYGLNYKDQRPDALAWLRRFGDPYAASAFDFDGKAGIDWGVYGVPETFLIDRDGIIRYKRIGPLTEEVLAEELLPLIEALKKPGPAA